MAGLGRPQAQAVAALAGARTAGNGERSLDLPDTLSRILGDFVVPEPQRL